MKIKKFLSKTDFKLLQEQKQVLEGELSMIGLDDELLSKKDLAKQLGWSYELWKGNERLGDAKTETYYWYNQEGNAYSEEEFNKLKKEDL